MKTKAWTFNIIASKTIDNTGFYINFEQYSLLVRRDWTWGNYQMYRDKITEAFSLRGYKYCNILGIKTKITIDDTTTLVPYDEIIDYFSILITQRALKNAPVVQIDQLKPVDLPTPVGLSDTLRPIVNPPEYKPKRGRLTIGTKLSVDYDNPINHGRSGADGQYTVLDILDQTVMSKVYQKTTTEKYYILIFKPNTPWVDDNIYSKPKTPMTADEIFSWLKIDKPVKETVKK